MAIKNIGQAYFGQSIETETPETTGIGGAVACIVPDDWAAEAVRDGRAGSGGAVVPVLVE